MSVKKEEFSIDELNQLLVDLGVEESSPRDPVETLLAPKRVLQDPHRERSTTSRYVSKKKNFLYPASLVVLFCLGFYGGALFSSTLSLAKRAIQLEERIEKHLDHLEKALLPPPELTEKREEVIEPLVEQKKEKILSKAKA
jgi:hypothetical protein